MQVLASKKYIYIVLEYVNGGEVFEKIVGLLYLVLHEIKGNYSVSIRWTQPTCWSQVESGKFPEDQARKYFQQLIHAVDYCHSRGVYHRDLKVSNRVVGSYKRLLCFFSSHGWVFYTTMHVNQPENLLLDVNGNLKVSDFGLSALSQQRRVSFSAYIQKILALNTMIWDWEL